MNHDVLKGIDCIYNSRFQEAERIFQKVISDFPDKPIGHFYVAMVSWSRLTEGFWSPENVQEFKARIDRAIDVAENRKGREDTDCYDYFYYGGSLGFKGRFELMRENYFESFILAVKAIFQR